MCTAWIILAHTVIYFNSQLKASESCVDGPRRQVVWSVLSWKNSTGQEEMGVRICGGIDLSAQEPPNLDICDWMVK